MSGLAAVLSGRVEPGTYRWHGAFDVAEVRHTVEHAGWGFGWLDGWHLGTKQEFLEAVGIALDFPDHYGQNFDALADCLLDVRGDTLLLWDGWGPLARADTQAFSVALSVLGTRVNAERGGAFCVLLRGDGPDVVGVSSLD
ncbi:MAG: barstar family protein [Nocardioides sp.]